MDPYASPPSPPPPPPPVPPARSEKVREEEDDGGWKVESIFISAKEMLGWCTEQYKSLGHKGVPPYLMVGGVIVVGFAALGLAVALPTRSRAVLVNFWGFLLPAVATIDEMDTTVCHRNKPPSGFTGYWVFYGLFGLLDGFLPAITPCYFFTKACVLTWAVSSARPYGGRPVINRAFEIINNTNRMEYKPLRDVLMVTKAMEPSEDMATQVGISRRAFRLGIVAVAVATRVFALGVASYIVLAVEGFFTSLPSWTQERVCVIVGASWPLYATLVARARSAAASKGTGDSKGDKQQRLGPAAVQWLSYWPIFALFLAILDPVMGWIPHYYSFKLVTLAFLALPQTRGAYVITSILLYGDDQGSKSGGTYPDSHLCGINPPLREGG